MVLVASTLAAERPDEVALRDDAVALGWADVNDTLNRVVNALGGLDLGPDRRVAVLAENSVETVLAHLGGLLAGASTVPVNFHLTVDEVAFILADSGARALFTGPETAATGVEAARRAGVPVVIGWRTPDVDGVTSWEQWLAAAPADEPSADVAPRPNLMYTSGTTGRPKGVELPPTMFAGGGTMREHVEALGRTGFAALGTHLVVGPMYHTGPLSGVRLLAAGIPVVVLGRFDGERVLEAIHTHRAESTVMVPTHFVRLLALPADVRDRYDVSSLQLVAHTGASCPVDVKRQMIEWFGPVLQDAYGATEVGTTCSITSAEWLEHPGSVGRAVPPFRAIIVGDDDMELPPGVEGRLYFEDATGRGIVYPGDPEKTAQAHLRPGVFTLGEIGYVTADGFVYITDRFSDMIVSGGANIYPAEAEQALVQHPGVADVAVIGVPNAEMGEEVKALVIPDDPAHPPSSDELIAWCRERLAGYKCPRSVEIVDSIGRNAMGKLNKRALRAPYWEGAGTDVDERTLSLAAGTVLDVEPPDAVDVAAAAGWDAVGLWFDTATWSAARTRAVVDRLAATGLTALDVEPVILGRGDDHGEALVDVAAELGAGHVLVASGAAERGEVVERFGALCERAAGTGVVVVLEFLPIFSVATLAAAVAIVEEVGHGGVLVDTLHLARSGGSPAELVPVRHLLPYLQLADAAAEPAGSLRDEALHGRLLPGDGTLPLPEVLATVPGVPVSVELRSRALVEAHPDPVDRARAVLRATQQVLSAQPT